MRISGYSSAFCPASNGYRSIGKQIPFKGIETSNTHKEVNGITIPLSNFKRLTNRRLGEPIILHYLKDIKASKNLPLEEGLKRTSALKDYFTPDMGYVIFYCANVELESMEKLSKHIKEIPYLKNREFVKILDNGCNSVVVDMGYNPARNEEEVLKIASVPNYPEALGRKNEPSFDLPVYEQGCINGVYYYVQPKATHEGLTQNHVEEIEQKIQNAGYETADDYGMHQIMMYKGQAYLVDPACAEKKYSKK